MQSRIAPAEAPWSPIVEKRLATLPHLLLFRVLARDDRLFARFMDGGLLDRGHLSLRERELTILTVCARNGSDYEWGVHVQLLAEAVGFTAAEIAATGAPFDTGIWRGRDALIVRLCDALQASSELEEDFWAELRAEFSEMALLELLLVIGKYRQVCILTNALRLEPEAGTPALPRPG
ncbi:carboxymuconolactone decarboxylase family protein [Phenylobacterium aquaticum]|uniref:carboxymuconolactone decarboxylase family protein n=1 Tax=Phenylobacterium aquaticum TaxID=1763816 RepID=UPI0026F2BF8F|nr:carboxymuconolactone decarboxylase family protein [Phenylobacterium aquaticum]